MLGTFKNICITTSEFLIDGSLLASVFVINNYSDLNDALKVCTSLLAVIILVVRLYRLFNKDGKSKDK